MIGIWSYVDVCLSIVEEANYAPSRILTMDTDWGNFAKWTEENKIVTGFFEAGCDYLDNVVGTHLFDRNLPERQRILIRNIRMLISYIENGVFEFRTPKAEYKAKGYIGNLINQYLVHCEDDLNLSKDTVRNKKYYLILFNEYIICNSLKLEDIDFQTLADFHSRHGFSLASIHNANSVLRNFFKYLEDENLVSLPLSIYIVNSNYKKKSKLPTVYDESEIRDLIKSVDRSGAIGKRDYLVLLLAGEYGWRAGDIVNFQFSQIDWDRNIIRIEQEKTKVRSEFPLLASVGNAIIDYLRYGRYKSNSPYVILSHSYSRRHQPLSAETVHSIVTKTFRNSQIKGWADKKHGPHSLRHSLATNLLKSNTSIPLISVILGHQNTETTKTYLSLDIESLRKCCLPVPSLGSRQYPHTKETGDG